MLLKRAVCALAILGGMGAAHAQTPPSVLQGQVSALPWTNGKGLITGADEQALWNVDISVFNTWAAPIVSPVFLNTASVAGDLWASTSGATPSTLFSTCGAPGSCNGVYLSNAQDLRAYTNIFDAAVIYSTTSRGGTIGENGLWINFNVNTGYLAPPFTNALDKAGLQVSSFCNSGGGQCWGEAISATYASGWAGASGNFGPTLELDPSNNATTNTNPLVGGFNTTLIGLWLAGPIGAFPITDYIQISPVSNNGSVYAADFGIFVTGAHTIQDYTIWDNANATLASYFDNGTHSYGISLAGSYTTAGINIAPGGGSSGVAIAIQPGSTVCFNANLDCISYAFSTVDINAPTTIAGPLTYGGVTLANLVTGTGSMVLSASPTLTGTLTAAAANFSGGALSSSPSGGVGYETGAGGAVTQATSKATGVALNTLTGAITLNNAALAAGAIVSFTLTDTSIAATDTLVLNHISGGTIGGYALNAGAAAGSATISVRNATGGSLSEAIVIEFAVVKGVTS